METSKKLIGKKSKDQTSSAEVTRVNLSVRQVNGEVKKIRGICGHGSEQPLANYDPDTQSWKMFGDISLWGDSPLLENLPVSGMTRNGVLYLQHPWEPITAETALLSWPTPRANTAMSATITPESAWNPNRQPNLEIVVGRRTWPTPVASDAWTTDLASSQVKEGSMHSVSLGRAVQMWPTPTTQETEHPDAVLTETGRRLSKDGKSSHSLGLADAVQMWPTPTVDDASNVNPKPNRFRGLVASVNELTTPGGNGGKLNPTWVEWLMGFPEGWTDLED
jgi:hypothetical protein